MELQDIYDKHGSLTGKTKMRGEELFEDEYVLVASVWIYDNEGKVLIQKRSVRKEYALGRWSMTGGVCLAGENSRQGCVREVWEELGIKIN